MNPLVELLKQILSMFLGTKEEDSVPGTPSIEAPTIEAPKVEVLSITEESAIEWHKSPNYKPKSGRKITAIILHHTASFNFESEVEWMCSPESKVSAHYLIGRNGKIAQLVLDENVAWHAGDSELSGVKWVNNFSIGIEMTGDTTKKPLTEEQWNSMIWLVKQLMTKYNIDPARIVSHREIAPGRKVDLDPANFDWGKFYKDIGFVD
jgi:N-acetylmuramoyl-L-alanine amidase